MSQVCAICKNPVVAGEARYTINENHYGCEFPNGKRDDSLGFKESEKKIDSALRALGVRKSKCREGQGLIAGKAKALAVAAIEAELGVAIFNVSVWIQQGAFRGARWGLDRWGMSFEFVQNGHIFRGQASSLSRMSDCVKSKALKAVPGNIAFSYEIEH